MAHKVMGICAGRKNGNGEIAVKAALKVLQDKGAEVEMINLFDYNILPCTGCEGCTMQMGNIAMGKQKEYKGCVLKDKDDVDALVTELHTCNGVIIAVPTYDLAPSSMYMRFAQRFLAYELSFLKEIGVVKEDPHTVAGLIAVGGSMHDWQPLALEVIQASMFTMSITPVDRMMLQRVGRPANVLIEDNADQLARAKEMGEHIWEAMETPVEDRKWLGDPNDGVCPRVRLRRHHGHQSRDRPSDAGHRPGEWPHPRPLHRQVPRRAPQRDRPDPHQLLPEAGRDQGRPGRVQGHGVPLPRPAGRQGVSRTRDR